MVKTINKHMLSLLFPPITNHDKKIEPMIDEESMSYITTPNTSQKIVSIITKYLKKYKDPKYSTIVDATGGVGGDTITFSNIFETVVSIELNSKRFSFLNNNIETYRLKNVIMINGDSTNIIPKLSNVDVVYIDPPWGGKSYKTEKDLRLKLGNLSLETVIIKFLLNSALNIYLLVVKLPKNYDLNFFYEKIKMNPKLNSKINIYFHELKKMLILVIEKYSL